MKQTSSVQRNPPTLSLLNYEESMAACWLVSLYYSAAPLLSLVALGNLSHFPSSVNAQDLKLILVYRVPPDLWCFQPLLTLSWQLRFWPFCASRNYTATALATAYASMTVAYHTFCLSYFHGGEVYNVSKINPICSFWKTICSFALKHACWR